MSIVGFITALLVATNMDELTIEQVIAVITAMSSLVAYIIGEGLTDAARARNGTEQKGGKNEE